MKLMKYQIVQHTIDHETVEDPNAEPVLICVARYSGNTTFESNYAIAQAEAYNGEVTVEDVEDPETEPTAQERIAALEEQMALADETAIELFEAQMAQEEINMAQDDALIELYEMMEGA